MTKPACVPCGLFFKPEKNGVLVAENKPIGGARQPPGKQAPELWEGYKIWRADKWKCAGCGTEIIMGYGFAPVSQDFMSDFHEYDGVEIQINDC